MSETPVGYCTIPTPPPNGFRLVTERGIQKRASWLWWSPTRQAWEPCMDSGSEYKDFETACYCRPIFDAEEFFECIETVEKTMVRLRTMAMEIQGGQNANQG
jgi:hypothetical protein